MVGLTLDINSLTVDEIDAVEEIIGGPIDNVGKPGTRRAPLMRAIAYVAGRRDNPEFTVEDAGRVRLSQIVQGSPDPTEPAES